MMQRLFYNNNGLSMAALAESIKWHGWELSVYRWLFIAPCVVFIVVAFLIEGDTPKEVVGEFLIWILLCMEFYF